MTVRVVHITLLETLSAFFFFFVGSRERKDGMPVVANRNVSCALRLTCSPLTSLASGGQ